MAEEFEHIMDLLTWSRLGKTPLGKKELVQIVAALAFTPDDWHPEDPEYVERIIQCTQHALPLFSVSVLLVFTLLYRLFKLFISFSVYH